MNGNVRWCSQDKINKKQNSIVQKKDEYNYVINKYIQKIYYQRRTLLIIGEEAIENYEAFKKSYKNENNGLTLIDTSSEENIQDSDMTQMLSTIKARNILIGQIKL